MINLNDVRGSQMIKTILNNSNSGEEGFQYPPSTNATHVFEFPDVRNLSTQFKTTVVDVIREHLTGINAEQKEFFEKALSFYIEEIVRLKTKIAPRRRADWVTNSVFSQELANTLIFPRWKNAFHRKEFTQEEKDRMVQELGYLVACTTDEDMKQIANDTEVMLKEINIAQMKSFEAGYDALSVFISTQ